MTEPGAAVLTLGPGGCGVAQLHGVRRWLRAHLSAPGQLVDAELVVTELITNAVDHGHGALAVRITITAGSRVRIEVEDANPCAHLTVGRSRLPAPRGHGLSIIDAVASWGVLRTSVSKTVWATL